MKKNFIVLLFALFSKTVPAQLLGGFFQQGNTQTKYLLQQIAALKVYTGYIQKGYSIAKQGLNTIGDIKRGEFNLHQNYFNSLKTVNPAIRKYAKVAAIIGLQVRIIQVYKKTSRLTASSDAFNKNELRYLAGVFSRLMDDCTKTIDELIAVTTSNQMEMKDDERIRRIDNLYSDMQDKYSFVQGFSNETELLGASRIREQNNIETSRAINGIK